ncbi:unnamed protein product [Ambrosiozyma monospora]|uniref:Unnamed protein product n=1 Tax=Ambrosiozyma monospora TaxID=43982 RepID=A0ACB5T8G3_AMBMO|nr:unnamed protein product [Ambrosiozyma monospora]
MHMHVNIAKETGAGAMFGTLGSINSNNSAIPDTNLINPLFRRFCLWPWPSEIEAEQLPLIRRSYRLFNLPILIEGCLKEINELQNTSRINNKRTVLMKCIDAYNDGDFRFVEGVESFKKELKGYEKLFF